MFDFLLQLGLAILLGFLIGLERQLTGHLAGIRTNILICLGTCLFLQLPIMLNLHTELARIESYVISGVGFLCSSVIFKEKGNVKGLNTGATLWCSAAIGVFIGANQLIFAILATLILILANIISRPIATKILPRENVFLENNPTYIISITCKESAEFLIRSFLINIAQEKKFYLISLDSTDTINNLVNIKAEYICLDKKAPMLIETFLTTCLKNDKVIAAKWEHLQN